MSSSSCHIPQNNTLISKAISTLPTAFCGRIGAPNKRIASHQLKSGLFNSVFVKHEPAYLTLVNQVIGDLASEYEKQKTNLTEPVKRKVVKISQEYDDPEYDSELENEQEITPQMISELQALEAKQQANRLKRAAAAASRGKHESKN